MYRDDLQKMPKSILSLRVPTRHVTLLIRRLAVTKPTAEYGVNESVNSLVWVSTNHSKLLLAGMSKKCLRLYDVRLHQISQPSVINHKVSFSLLLPSSSFSCSACMLVLSIHFQTRFSSEKVRKGSSQMRTRNTTWPIYRYRPQKSHIGRSLVKTM